MDVGLLDIPTPLISKVPHAPWMWTVSDHRRLAPSIQTTMGHEPLATLLLHPQRSSAGALQHTTFTHLTTRKQLFSSNCTIVIKTVINNLI